MPGAKLRPARPRRSGALVLAASVLLVPAGLRAQTSEQPAVKPRPAKENQAPAASPKSSPQPQASQAPANPSPNLRKTLDTAGPPAAGAPASAGKPTPNAPLVPAAAAAVASGGSGQPAQPGLQGQPGAAPAAQSEHVLTGSWKVYWIDQNKATELRVAQVFPGKQVTNFIGAVATLGGEACPLTGSVVDSLAGQFSDGLEQKTHVVSAFVVLRAQCQSGQQLWIEAFGLPSGQILMSGRATSIPANGPRSYLSVGLGR